MFLKFVPKIMYRGKNHICEKTWKEEEKYAWGNNFQKPIGKKSLTFVDRLGRREWTPKNRQKTKKKNYGYRVNGCRHPQWWNKSKRRRCIQSGCSWKICLIFPIFNSCVVTTSSLLDQKCLTVFHKTYKIIIKVNLIQLASKLMLKGQILCC